MRTEVAGENEHRRVQLIDDGGVSAIGDYRWCCLGDGVLDTGASELFCGLKGYNGGWGHLYGVKVRDWKRGQELCITFPRWCTRR